MFAPFGFHADPGEKTLMKCTFVAACALLAAVSAPSFAQTLSLVVTSPPQSFFITISAQISGTSSLAGGTFVIQYSPQQIQFSSVTQGALLTSAGVTNFAPSPTTTSTETVTFSGGSKTTSGSGSIADFTFTAGGFASGPSMVSLTSATNFTTIGGGSITITRGGPVSISVPMPAAVPEPGANGLALSALCGGLLTFGLRRKFGKPSPVG